MKEEEGPGCLAPDKSINRTVFVKCMYQDQQNCVRTAQVSKETSPLSRRCSDLTTVQCLARPCPRPLGRESRYSDARSTRSIHGSETEISVTSCMTRFYSSSHHPVIPTIRYSDVKFLQNNTEKESSPTSKN